MEPQTNPILAAAGIVPINNLAKTTGTNKSRTNTANTRVETGSSRASGTSGTVSSGSSTGSGSGTSSNASSGRTSGNTSGNTSGSQTREQMVLVPSISGTKQIDLVDSIVAQGAAGIADAQRINKKALDSARRAEVHGSQVAASDLIIQGTKNRAVAAAKGEAADIFEHTDKIQLLTDLNQKLTDDIRKAEDKQAVYLKDVNATIEEDGILGWLGANLTMSSNYQAAHEAEGAVASTKANIRAIQEASTDTNKALLDNARTTSLATVKAENDKLIATAKQENIMSEQQLAETGAANMVAARKFNVASVNAALAARAAKFEKFVTVSNNTSTSATDSDTSNKSTGTSTKKSSSTSANISDVTSTSTKRNQANAKSTGTSDTEGSSTGTTGTYDPATATMEEQTRQYNIYARANGKEQRTVVQMASQLGTPGEAANESNMGIYLGWNIQRQEKAAEAANTTTPLASTFYLAKEAFIANKARANEVNPITKFLARVDAEVVDAIGGAKMTVESLAQAVNATSSSIIRRERGNITKESLFYAPPLLILGENAKVADTYLYKEVFSKVASEAMDTQELFDLAYAEIKENRITSNKAVREMNLIFSYAALINSEKNKYEELLISPQTSYKVRLEIDGATGGVVPTDLMSSASLGRAFAIRRAELHILSRPYTDPKLKDKERTTEARSLFGATTDGLRLGQIPDTRTDAQKVKDIRDKANQN